jgi:hypothetical protein
MLQQSSAVGSAASWSDVGAPVVVTDGKQTISQAVTPGQRFYRLRGGP